MVIRLGGRGDFRGTHVAWRVPPGAPYISSILYYDGLIYMANGNGIVTAVDAETGALALGLMQSWPPGLPL